MTLILQSLVSLTLLTCGAVAAVPVVLHRPEPVAADAEAPLAVAPESLRLVEAPGGRWFLNGDPIGRAALADLLRQQGGVQAVRYLPSAALPVGEVASSLAWLRRSGAASAMLAIPPREP
jgi:hypothetical protein